MPNKAMKEKKPTKTKRNSKSRELEADAKTAQEALEAIKSFRNLSPEVLTSALNDAIEVGYRKSHGLKTARIRTELDPKGGLKAFRIWDVVETVEDPETQLDVEEAKDITPNPIVGQVLEEEADIEDFVRNDISTVKSVMLQKFKDAEKQEIFEEYRDRVSDMVDGLIHSVENNFVMVRLGADQEGKLQPGATDAVMRKSDQIPGEEYIEGKMIRVVITKVEKESKGAMVMVSRSCNDMIKRLFEKEVAEISSGTIEIKAIARDPGLRAKMAVISNNENIDPIGACIGPGGSRVRAVSSNLNGEKIDIFEWSDDLQQLVANALSPAQGVQIFPHEKAADKLGSEKVRRSTRDRNPNDDSRTLVAAVPDNQLSLAIGKKGQNARLAYKLTGYRIDIRSQSELDELGIDWRGYVEEMHREYEEKKARERAYKQQKRIEELQNSNEPTANIADVADYDYDVDYDDRHLDRMDTLASREAQYESEAEPANEAPKTAESSVSVKEKELDEMEEAARIAKEKRKSLSEKRTTYVSKFESAAEAPKAEPAKPAKPSKGKDDAKKEKDERRKERKKPAFNVLHPIYTDEELAEIEDNEIEEEENRYSDDIDYEDYDSYYEE